MERTKKVVEETETPQLQWKKIGGGALYWNNQIIKPGQLFFANREDLPKAFLSSLECMNPEKLKELDEAIAKETQTPEILYVLKKVKNTNLYNVINSENKAINEEPLSKEDAEEMLTAMNK